MKRLFLSLFLAGTVSQAQASVDLSIGFDHKTDRPNLFIAWRNTERILEVELEVKNHGDQQGSGRVQVCILDEEGRVLASHPGRESQPIRVTLPASANGGREGKVVQVHGSKALNQLIDRLDRANARYLLKAEILTDQPDADPVNNSSVKTFNVSSRVRPGAVHFRDYYIRNPGDQPVEVEWRFDHSAIPSGWEVTTEPKRGERKRIEPGTVVQGYAIVTTPKELEQGDHIDLRFAAVDAEKRIVVGQYEWFLVYDTSPPELTGVSFSVDKDTGLTEVTATANDVTSMIKEASGVPSSIRPTAG